MAAAVQPNCLWNPHKTFYKTFFQTCRPRLNNFYSTRYTNIYIAAFYDYKANSHLSRPRPERRRRGRTTVRHVVRLVAGAVDPVGVGRVDGPRLAGRVRPLQRGQSPRVPRGRHGRWRPLRQLRTLRTDDIMVQRLRPLVRLSTGQMICRPNHSNPSNS